MNTEKMSLSDKIQNTVGPFATKVNNNIYLTSVRDAMLAYMPFTFIASIFLIIAFFPITQVTDFITMILGTENAFVWQSKLLYVNSATLAVGGLIVVISMAKSLADKLETNVLQCIITAVVSFLLLTPLDNIEGVDFLNITKISAQSMFLSILVGMSSTIIYKKIEERGIKIKLPESVPPAVAGPFESVIPSFIVVTTFFIIRLIIELLLKSDALTLINGTLGKPLTYLGGSIGGLVVVKIFEQFLWFFGLHGGSIIQAVMDPIHQVLEDQNKVASLAGAIPPNIISMSFRNHFASIGVVGAVIAILIVAKSRQYKEVGKISSVPYMFNIGEPALFGIPLMLNFLYFIPFIFSNAISTIVAYVVFAMGLVPLPTGLAQIPWTTPPIISGYFVTGSIRGSLLQIALIAITTLVWIPFVRMADKELYKEEKEMDSTDSDATVQEAEGIR
ncbi:PTS system, cellobiose-specific IIC component [Trichococcus flocculiformis]|uniref:PTS sugar transporter subunit IIC n=1 Tax=Trichococcus TaxID=82802 RepID=UPI0007A8FA29|nr:MULTISPECIES: PTS transporter subunit EIIC [Trichococcus]CZQ96292.1 phosphotransferase system eiic [Trichococcus sp. ES5]SHF53336.1 PTS system, cellobiose-specific IIC component [Trichococcus flocculiformis]